MADRIVTPNRWLWFPRYRPIRFIEIHSTRGGVNSSTENDYFATGNWMTNPNNGSSAQGWGSSCSRVLGPAGEMTFVLNDNQMPTHSAGYGRTGTWSIDEYGKSYEWAQHIATVPYSDAMYRRGAKEIAKDCVTYGIPPVFITIYDQAIQPVPTGLVRHDRCENGTKLGKSDPGSPFNEAYFISLLKIEIALLTTPIPIPPQEDDMTLTTAQEEKLNRLLNDQVFVRPQGRSEVYRFMEDQSLVGVVSGDVFLVEGTWPEVKELPKTHPIWKLRTTYPSGVPAELLV